MSFCLVVMVSPPFGGGGSPSPGELLENVTLQDPNPNGFYDIYYELPAELIEGKAKITVTFKATADSYAGGIFDKLSIVKSN